MPAPEGGYAPFHLSNGQLASPTGPQVLPKVDPRAPLPPLALARAPPTSVRVQRSGSRTLSSRRGTRASLPALSRDQQRPEATTLHASGAREVRTGPGDGDGDGDGDGNADGGSGRATYSEWESMKPGRHHPTSDQ